MMCLANRLELVDRHGEGKQKGTLLFFTEDDLMPVAKSWGETSEIYNDGRISIERISVRAGGYCSIHRHADKDNVFSVVSGVLRVYVASRQVGNLLEEARRVALPWESKLGFASYLLTPESGRLVVEAGRYHIFEAVEAVEAVEVYHAIGGAPLRADDIKRLTVGGVRPMSAVA